MSMDTKDYTDISNGEGHLYTNTKDGLPRFDGTAKWHNDFDEACEGYFHGLRVEDRPFAASRVKTQLFGQAKLLTKSDAKISYDALENLGKEKPKDALRLLCATVKKECEAPTVINQREVFLQFFKTHARRRWGEEVPAYKQRRDEEYERMCKPNPGTQISKNLLNFFLLDGMGISEQEHLDLLRHTDHKYEDTEKIMEHLKIQFFEIGKKELEGKRQRPRRASSAPAPSPAAKAQAMGRGKGSDARGYARGKMDTSKVTSKGPKARAYLQEVSSASDGDDVSSTFLGQGTLDDGSGEDAPSSSSAGGSAQVFWADSDGDGEKQNSSSSQEQGYDRASALVEFQNYLQAVDLGATSDAKAERVAQATQEIYATSGNPRRVVDKAKKGGFTGRFEAKGQLSFPDSEMAKKLQDLKSRTRCRDCDEQGHWAGDPECPSPSKASLALRQRREAAAKMAPKKKPGGFLKKAGLALLQLITVGTGLKLRAGSGGAMAEHFSSSPVVSQPLEHEELAPLLDFMKNEVEVFVNSPIGERPLYAPVTTNSSFSSFGPEKYVKMSEKLPPPPKNVEGESFALVDTGALIPMGGSKELQGLHLVAGSPEVESSSWNFTGIKKSAKVPSLGLARFQCAIGGIPLQLGFEFTNEDIPLLLALPQLDGVGAILDLPRRLLHMTAVGRFNIPLHRFPSGHIGVRLDDYHGTEGDDQAPVNLLAAAVELAPKPETSPLPTGDSAGVRSERTRVMGKKVRKFYEGESHALFAQDAEMWTTFNKPRFPLVNEAYVQGGLYSSVDKVQKKFLEAESNETKLFWLELGETDLRTLDPGDEPIDANPEVLLKSFSAGENRKAELMLWSDRLLSCMDKGRDFLVDLPHDYDPKDLGPLAWLHECDALFSCSSWMAQESAKGAHGLPFSDVPERRWISTSECLLNTLGEEGYMELMNKEEAEVFAAEKRKAEPEEEGTESGDGPPRLRRRAPAGKKRPRRAQPTTSSSSAAASSSSSSSSPSSGVVPPRERYTYPPCDGVTKPCKRCEKERLGLPWTGPHSRVPGAGCRLEGVVGNPKRARPDADPSPLASGAATAGSSSGRTKKPRVGSERTTPGGSSRVLFRREESEGDEGSDSAAGEEVDPLAPPDGDEAPVEGPEVEMELEMDKDEPPGAMPEGGGSSSSVGPSPGLPEAAERRLSEDPDADEDMPGEDPDRARDPLLPPTPAEDAKEKRRRAEWRALPLELRRAIKRLHDHIGHFGNKNMIRLLRDARASKRAIRAAALFRCPDCLAANRANTSGPPAAEIRAYRFGDVIYTDLTINYDVHGKAYVSIVVVDAATGFGIGIPLRRTQGTKPKASQVLEAFTDSWLSWAPPPKAIYADQDTSFKAEMQEWTELYGTLVIPVARGAHFQLGVAERRIGALRVAIEALVVEKQLSGARDVYRGVVSVMASGNRLIRQGGYSPSQWVLGQDVTLPGDLVLPGRRGQSGCS